jgi:hypothetical protein
MTAKTGTPLVISLYPHIGASNENYNIVNQFEWEHTFTHQWAKYKWSKKYKWSLTEVLGKIDRKITNISSSYPIIVLCDNHAIKLELWWTLSLE